MKNNYLFLIIFILVLANLYFLLESTGSANSTIKEESISRIEQNIKQDFDGYLDNVFRWTYTMNGTLISFDKTVHDSRNNPVPLKKLVQDHPVVIADFRYATCQVCLVNEIELLSKLSDKVGPGKVFLIKDFIDSREHLAFEDEFNVKTLSASTEKNLYPLKGGLQASVFVVDTSGIMRDYFVPIKATEAFHGRYYELVCEKYFSTQ